MTQPRGRRVQDDTREIAVARLLELTLGESRIGPDATDEHGNPYELKSTTTTSVTTARDLGLEYLARMRERYWVFARGTQEPYFVPDEIYFLHPDDLEGWIGRYEDRLAADLRIVESASQAFAEADASQDELNRFAEIVRRGVTINNPKITWNYVTQNGTPLGSTPSVDLRALVAERPLSS